MTFYPEYVVKIRFPLKILTLNATSMCIKCGMCDQIQFVHFYFIFLSSIRCSFICLDFSLNFVCIAVVGMPPLVIISHRWLYFNSDSIHAINIQYTVLCSSCFSRWLVLYISIPNTVYYIFELNLDSDAYPIFENLQCIRTMDWEIRYLNWLDTIKYTIFHVKFLHP